MLSSSLYFFGSLAFLFFGILSFGLGVLFLSKGLVVFLDWEFFCLNSCSLCMTLLFDWMSLMFVGCVFVISSMVMYYSYSYMHSDDNSVRFYFLVFLFIMSMVMMVISPNLMSILIGWDGLGLVSYCLVIYYQNYDSYNSGMLTILSNRVGDVAILLAIAWMLNFGSWHFIFYMGIWDSWMFYLIVLIVLAGFTSSAQIPFSSWLPAAMAAPTPVSSLVHSSTLVTAGVYLVIRFSDLLSSINCSLMLFLSLVTMTMSGMMANYEYDLSSVIALSTLSQLGLMMFILFMGYPILSFFHLLTHAFFSALMFLCAGLMIHSMGGSQDIRHMGVMVNSLPFTCTCFMISNMSLCGLPFLAGFYSKDMIMETMFFSSYNFIMFLLFFSSIGMTAAYSLRLVYYCISHNNNLYVCQSYDEDKIMATSMITLTFLSIVGGSFMGWLLFDTPNFVLVPSFISAVPLILILLGGFLGYNLPYYNFNLLLSRGLYNYMSSMWYFLDFSTLLMYDLSSNLSISTFVCMDGGWGENMVSLSPPLYFHKLSNWMDYYSANNVSVFMLVFFFIFVVSMF